MNGWSCAADHLTQADQACEAMQDHRQIEARKAITNSNSKKMVYVGKYFKKFMNIFHSYNYLVQPH